MWILSPFGRVLDIKKTGLSLYYLSFERNFHLNPQFFLLFEKLLKIRILCFSGKTPRCSPHVFIINTRGCTGAFLGWKSHIIYRIFALGQRPLRPVPINFFGMILQAQALFTYNHTVFQGFARLHGCLPFPARADVCIHLPH